MVLGHCNENADFAEDVNTNQRLRELLTHPDSTCSLTAFGAQ